MIGYERYHNMELDLLSAHEPWKEYYLTTWLIPYHFSKVTATYLFEEHVPWNNWVTILEPAPHSLT